MSFFGEHSARASANHRSEIVASAYAYPSELVDNALFLSRCEFDLGADVSALAAETQLRTRLWCTAEENTWTMTQELLRKLSAQVPSLRDELDLVIVASGTTMPVMHAPEADNAGVADLAPLVLRDLEVDGALGFDVKACYCTGFLRGLQIADGLLQNPNYRTALVIATEQGSRFSIASTNRSKFCFIMSDAAGGVLLRRVDDPDTSRAGIVDYCARTAASKFDWVGIGADAASTIMRGSKAGEATVGMLHECGSTLLRRNGLTPSDVKWLLPIQTHKGIVDAATSALEFSSEQLLWFGGDTGFSGSASIPACLGEQLEKKRIAKGDLILSVAVGAGMNCGGVLYRA